MLSINLKERRVVVPWSHGPARLTKRRGWRVVVLGSRGQVRYRASNSYPIN